MVRSPSASCMYMQRDSFALPSTVMLAMVLATRASSGVSISVQAPSMSPVWRTSNACCRRPASPLSKATKLSSSTCSCGARFSEKWRGLLPTRSWVTSPSAMVAVSACGLSTRRCNLSPPSHDSSPETTSGRSSTCMKRASANAVCAGAGWPSAAIRVCADDGAAGSDAEALAHSGRVRLSNSRRVLPEIIEIEPVVGSHVNVVFQPLRVAADQGVQGGPALLPRDVHPLAEVFEDQAVAVAPQVQPEAQ